MKQFERNEYGISDAALEQRVAELTPAEFAALEARTRFPKLTPEQIKIEADRAAGRAKAQMLADARAEMGEHAGTVAFGTQMTSPPEQTDSHR